jgi:beta-galactosidase
LQAGFQKVRDKGFSIQGAAPRTGWRVLKGDSIMDSRPLSRRSFVKTTAVEGVILAVSPDLAHWLGAGDGVAHADIAGSIPTRPEIDLRPREHLLFDFDWRFFQGHADDPTRDLGFGKVRYAEDLSTTGDLKFAMPGFDDTSWRTVNLPHDWGVELPFVYDKELPSPYGLESRGYKPLGRRYPETSVGWYRRVFDVLESDLGRRIFIDFDGAFQSSLVFCNGCFVGRNNSGYVPFRFDLTDFLFYGRKNCITVRVDASLGEGWYYEGAGIYRHVWITKVDPLHLGQWDTVVRTEVQGRAASLELSTVVENSGPVKQDCRVGWQILDAAGKIVATAGSPTTEVPADSKQGFSATAKLADVALWSPETPSLYFAVATVESAGAVRDRDRVTFGVRTLAFDVNQGFLLNGRRIAVRGTCNHQDHAGVGVALPDRLQSYRVEVLQRVGCNAVRTSHHMPTPEWVEACERLGMLMLCETRCMSASEEGIAQMETMIKRYRNSPAIFLWSLGNEEVTLQSNEVGPRVIQTMQGHAHRMDPTRACTAGVLGSPLERSFAPVLDVMGFNHNLSDPDKYHKDHPRQPLIGTEGPSTVATRGIYTTDKLRNWISAYDANDKAVSERADEYLSFFAARPWLSGGFVWTGFDYRGEPTPYSWPSISSQFGIVDTCGFPKDNYFYYKAWWGKDPVLHLFPHWNWAGREGEEILVWVHSNLDSVELFCNGQSLGSKKVERFRHLEWRVKYAPGTLEARGVKDGKAALTARRETTGAPVKVILTADRTRIAADGEDLAIIRVATVDGDGRTVPVADNLIRFKVSGEGLLIGVGNGDPNCQEWDNGSQRSLFNGLAQVILQSTKKPGLLTIDATSEGLEAATLSIETKEVRLRPAVA